MTKPLMIDLFAGLGGWADGLLAEGFDVIGFDIERHIYGEHRYPAQLVIQDVRTPHGRQFRDAALIVASPPCQRYSWMAMPWKKAKVAAAAIPADEQRDDNRPENLELWASRQPRGQRVTDLVAWAKEILEIYGAIT
jgi:site-specific DNA-cytosine methylase